MEYVLEVKQGRFWRIWIWLEESGQWGLFRIVLEGLLRA